MLKAIQETAEETLGIELKIRGVCAGGVRLQGKEEKDVWVTYYRETGYFYYHPRGRED